MAAAPAFGTSLLGSVLLAARSPHHWAWWGQGTAQTPQCLRWGHNCSHCTLIRDVTGPDTHGGGTSGPNTCSSHTGLGRSEDVGWEGGTQPL